MFKYQASVEAYLTYYGVVFAATEAEARELLTKKYENQCHNQPLFLEVSEVTQTSGIVEVGDGEN